MSSNLPSGSSNQDRLYKDVITTIEATQYLVNFIIISFAFGLSISNREFSIYLLITIATTSVTIVSTVSQVFKAIIDLLSRIERNTRSE
ncbi:hypothetical protein [Floridanema evergladense]|uniref:Uncharacterized protein n=1 Tax=Floridaenema evergladense BLCC-F167 TaxID=3153639 RepID=A0ABV4WMC6_9CYAN